jgi:hypothetical protein
MKSSSLVPSWVVWLGRYLGAASTGRELPALVGDARVGDIAEEWHGA